MLRDQHCDVKQLKDLSHRLEDSGYDSVLLTFHSAQADYFIKSAAALTPGHKLKYMIALRPYHVSAQYAAMMTIGYDQIDSNRLVFNWVAGDFHQREDEPDLEFDIFGESESVDSIQKRTTYLRNFVNMYKLYCPIKARPPMVFSGFSDYALETVRMFKGTSLCMLDTYRDNMDKFEGIEGRMVSAGITIIESDKDIEEYKAKVTTFNPRHLDFSIVGNYQTVKEEIINLKNEGITDLLLFTNTNNLEDSWNQKNDMMVHKLVKEINSEAAQDDN
jgi:alkanesulfonate monooxygenase SsuD/methylene tetrahydromethanopterin reductase-like flavin-dependent oxidoreductase (luciferase family)